MSILLEKNKKVLIQGITGREGRARTKLMLDIGTKVVAGVTPGQGGVEVLGVPVYDTVTEAVIINGSIDVTVVFVPAPLVKNAVIEAFASGIKLAVIVPDRVPVYDVMAISRAAEKYGAWFTGPNTLGIMSPGIGILGMIGGNAASVRKWFKSGPVGITSRSGGLTTSTAYYLNKAGIGQSTIVHVGGDSLIGLPHPEIVKLFQEDEDTKLIVLLGEIGGSQEEEVAELLASGKVTKPIVAYVGGRGAKEGTQFSHAGAIIEGNRGTYQGKVDSLRAAGAVVVDDISEIAGEVKKILDKLRIPYVR
ncbi:MAG: CoA-binding protein [Spirochaetia bacterium]|jgi:succinyl-CoA synthetase alpha subunit|nr:CoA-binding protein [Spirochaetia bacterium]